MKTTEARKVWTFHGKQHNAWWTADPSLMSMAEGSFLYDPTAHNGVHWFRYWVGDEISHRYWVPVHNVEEVPSEYRTKLLLLR